MPINKSLSVIIACYLDGGSVQECYQRLSAILPTITPDYEIIYVNDASPDNAEVLLTELARQDPRVVVINHTRNFGSQNAFLSGMTASRGDGVILMDGDLQDPPHLIPSLVEKWLEGYQIVYGTRVKRKETRFRQISYKLFYHLFQRMAAFEVPLHAGDFGLMDRRVVDVLLHEFPERLAFLRGLRAFTGFRHIGIDYVREQRFDGRSTNSLRRNIQWAKLAIFSFSHKPLEYIFFLALSSVVLTLLAGIFYCVVYVLAYIHGMETPPPGYMTLLLIMLFLSSIQFMILAVLAEYLGHIYEEVKARPRYLIRDMVDNRALRGRPPQEVQDNDC